MADPVGAADNSYGETMAAPSAAHADSASLAWSSGSHVPDGENMPPGDAGRPPEHRGTAEPAVIAQPWTMVLSRAAAVLLVCLGLAAVIVAAGWALNRNKDPGTSAPVATTTAPAKASVSTTTTTVASSADQDARFMTALSDKGIEFNEPADTVVANAKVVCQNLDSGMSVPQVVAQFRQQAPKVAAHADDFVAISVRTYCPKYSKLVAPG